MFSERIRGFGIIFVGNGPALKDKIEDNDTVVVKIEDESVLIKQVEAIGSNRFKGIVYGFEPSFALSYHGLSLDETVEFEERHVVSCGLPA